MLKKLLLASLLLVALVGLPLTVYIFQSQTRLASHASAGTSISLIPQPGPGNSIEKMINETVSVDLMVNPGSNAVTIIRLQVKYDPTKLQPVGANPFVLNPPVVPTDPTFVVLDGPVISNGTISELISVGSDTSKAIKTIKKVGTFNFKTIDTTPEGTPTILSFTNQTKAFSSGSNDQASENILNGMNLAEITINGILPSTTPTLHPTVTPSATPTTTPEPTDTPTPTPTPTSGPPIIRFSITAFLHSIGESGDNANPNSSLSNKNPQQQPRTFTISVYNATEQLVVNKTGPLNFDSEDGNFQGVISLGTNLTTGDYIIRVKTTSFLQKRVPGFIHILPSTQVNLPAITLVAGDTNGDNIIGLTDYNMIIGCYSDFSPPSFCDDIKAVQTDLNDDGHVNQIDYNLFLREITAQGGN